MTTKEYLANKAAAHDDKYIAFEYTYGDSEQDLPAFIKEAAIGVDQNNMAGRAVYAYTPNLLRNYFDKLTDEAKLNEMNNIDNFQSKCNRIANYSVTNGLSQQNDWDKAINYCVNELEYTNDAENEK